MQNDGYVFDCLNVRSFDKHLKKRKPQLKPYENQNDEQFDLLVNTFLAYLQEWKDNIAARPGNFTQTARGKMFLSWQTYEALMITTYSVIGAVQFLLQEGFTNVLTERFCQDPVEEYFGNQRKLGRRCDNPDLAQFGYNDNTIRIQRNVSYTSGNTRGKYDTKRSWEEISNKVVPKRKFKNQQP